MSERGALVRRVLVVLLALTAIAAILTSFQRSATPPARAATPVLATPMWSIRRTPQPVVDAVGAQHLTARLRAQTNGNRACFTVHDSQGELADASDDQPLAPASTLKLLTATSAVADLGADFHFTTSVQGSGPPANGTVDRLYLVGRGDPLLATPERLALDQRDPDTAGLASTPLAVLADRIAAAGIHAVPGGVVGIDAHFDRTRYVPEWNAAERASIGPVGALTVNDGFAGANGTGAPAANPAVNAATELTRLLTARHIAVGAPSSGDVPNGTVDIASIDSPPLPAILTEMLSASDNLSAEMLVRELGAYAGTATTARGVDAVMAAMSKLGIDTTGAKLVDGSGLSHTDAVTCRTLIAVLGLTVRPQFAPVRDGLAIAAQRGTLATRFRNTPLAGNLRAKTGTLDGVSGLAGFVTSDRPLDFALIVNGTFGESAAFAIREAMATTIASFPQTTNAATLVPAPNAPNRR